MNSGFITLPRLIQVLDIWYSKPFFLKVWFYFILNAEYQDRGSLKRGQLFSSTSKIISDCYWYEGYIKHSPTKDQVRAAIKYLRQDREWPIEDLEGNPIHSPMITTRKTTHGMIVTVCNYDMLADALNTARPTEKRNATASATFMDAQRTLGERPDIIKENTNKNAKKRTPAEPDLLSSCKTIAEKFNTLNDSNSMHPYNIEDVKGYVTELFYAGYDENDICSVIDRQWLAWRDNNTMRTNIKPSTLLNLSKFKEYLNAPVTLDVQRKKQNQAQLDKYEKAADERREELLTVKDRLSSTDMRKDREEYKNLKEKEATLEDTIKRLEDRINNLRLQEAIAMN